MSENKRLVGDITTGYSFMTDDQFVIAEAIKTELRKALKDDAKTKKKLEGLMDVPSWYPSCFAVPARGGGKAYAAPEWPRPNLHIVDVIFNNPATIVFWADGTKTVVKAIDEPFDEEKGLAMAIAKKAYGNKGNYFNKFKKWLPKIKED